MLQKSVNKTEVTCIYIIIYLNIQMKTRTNKNKNSNLRNKPKYNCLQSQYKS